MNLDEGTVLLTATKNKREAILPLSNSLVEILNEYIEYREGDDEDYFFCTNEGKQMTSSCITSAIERYNKRRGVDITSIHALRHTFAKQYIVNGGDAFRLQRLLTHSDIKTTQVYVNMFGNELAQGFDKLNPLEVYAKKNKKKLIKLK